MKRLLSLPCFVLLQLTLLASGIRADIFQWEYINPANPALGKQQSTTLCTDGAGQNAVPDSYLYGDLTMAYLIGADMTGTYGISAGFTAADLSQANISLGNFEHANFANSNLNHANLTYGDFYNATFTGADFNQANLT